MSTLSEYAQKGMAAIQEQKFDEAIAAFIEAVKLAEDRPDMNHALGMAYLHRGDVGNAIPHLERAVALSEPYTDPGVQAIKRDMHVSLATALQLMDRVPDARALLERIVKTWPEEADPRLQLGSLLLSTGDLDAGRALYAQTASILPAESAEAAHALVGTLDAFFEAELQGDVFLQAHQESYADYFTQVAADQVKNGWYAEAARMARGNDGELTPIVADGARPYALSRVDLVNPRDGQVANVYSEQEPMIVAVNGLEPLSQVPVVFPWTGWPFTVQVCSRCPWHWLTITVQFELPGEPEEVIARVDETIGDWYLSGWNGSFGEKDTGRFHYISDPENVGQRAVSYTVDLGRARYEAIPALLKRLAVLHDKQPIHRVQFGFARLAD